MTNEQHYGSKHSVKRQEVIFVPKKFNIMIIAIFIIMFLMSCAILGFWGSIAFTILCGLVVWAQIWDDERRIKKDKEKNKKNNIE